MPEIIFDNTHNASVNVQALELTNALKEIIDSLKSPQDTISGILDEISTITQGNTIIQSLIKLGGNAKGVSLQIDDDPALPLQNQRRDTSGFYHFVESAGKSIRQNQNNDAYKIVKQYLDGEIQLSDVTDDQRIILGKYSGNGGNLTDNLSGMEGSAFEYFTPLPIASGIWDALAEMGFSGGKVLDPCGGTGIFGATAPLNAAIDSVELDQTSGTVNKLINESDTYKVTVSNFEKVAANTPDETYDAIVSNVPFGDNREGNQFDDPKYQKETLENYFILRSLDKLKPNGLAAFLVPPRCTSDLGGAPAKMRLQASFKAEFLGAYRLPNKVFGAASADTITDIIFFRKFSRTAAEKIAELRESSPEILTKSNVLWDEYLDGKYFKTTEGIKHTLGEFIPKDPNKFRDVNRVVNAASIPDIAKLLRKLPKSRIDWALLDESETTVITYNEGDTISQDGLILQMKDGAWVAIDSPKTDEKYIQYERVMGSALSAFDAGVTYNDLRDYSAHLFKTSQTIKTPTWMKQIERSLESIDIANRPDAFQTFLVGVSVIEALDTEGRSNGVNFLAEYAQLSEAMKTCAPLAKRYKAKGLVKTGLDNILFNYDRKNGYSNLWKGEISNIDNLIQLTPDSSFEGLIYKNKSPWVTIDEAKSIYGDSFNPFMSDDWCISLDGQKVIRADDYFVGNFKRIADELDQQMSTASDEKIKNKLMQQKATAYSRIKSIDVEKLSFNIRSPYIKPEEKIEFLRTYIDKSADIEVDESGKEKIKFHFKESEIKQNFDLKIYKRFAAYIESGNATLAGADFGGEEAEAIKQLRVLIATTNEQFNGWVHSNQRILDRLNTVANDPKRQQFEQADDESNLVIQGMNPNLTLHGYQNSFVRKMSRSFEGINGFDVGLGKTFTSLASVQYVQTIGVKKKTIFVVPNSVLSNWHKEAKGAYQTIEDCLFIGLREVNGKLVSDSSLYDADLHRVLENNHNKIFMTMEAFERIKLKNQTIENFETYLRTIDQSFAESENRKKDSKAKNQAKTLVQILVGKEGSAPYLEDMGVDSIVIDEAHCYKNSAETVDFQGGKYLSVANSSNRGMDAQAKAWYIRGEQSKGDGVLLLTATPVTNSPLEIYSMLSLAVGHGRVNDMAIDTKGADGFMGAVCVMVNEEDEGIDGTLRDMQVFKGLTNTEMLSKSINNVATIKDAKMVGKSIFVPEATETPTDVALPEDVIERLKKYKLAYRFASALAADKPVPDQGEAEYEEMKDKFGEEDDVLGHPFNLIRKMTNLIADPELDDMISAYIFPKKDHKKMVEIVNQWNAKKPKEQWTKLTPHTADNDLISTKVSKNKTTGKESVKYTVGIRAWIDGNRICINSTNWDTQEKLERMLDKAEIDTDVSIPAKLSALLANFKDECARPRGVVRNAEGMEVKLPYAKQIIFCDMLGMHNKIRKLLVKHAGIDAANIIIVTGQRNNDPSDLLDIQNGFNAVEDNRYKVIIANEKAEVGVNFQNGTQANHHLTIGWTPDSLQQRNGRSARQGNLTDHVKSYFYDAMGTFDTAKRTLVDSKATWINDLLSDGHDGDVDIVGGMDRQQLEGLIDNTGDVDAITRMQEQLMQTQKATRIQQNRFKQIVNINTILKENKFLNENKTVNDWISKSLGELVSKVTKRDAFQKRIDNPDATLTAIAKNKDLLASVQAEIDVLVQYINDAVVIKDGDWSENKPVENGEIYDPVSLVQSFLASAKNGEKTAQYLVNSLKKRQAGRTKIYMELKDGSALENDWHSQVDMSERIRKNAANSYEDQAQREGALADSITGEFLNGQGSIILGQLVTQNTFIVVNGDPTQGFYAVGNLGVLGGRMNGLIADKQITSYAENLLSDSKNVIAYPNSVLHEECLSLAAKYEDDLHNAGKWDSSSFISKTSPLVAARRSTEAVCGYSYSYELPTPHFPIVEPDSAIIEGMVVRAKIHEAQANVVKRFDKHEFWVLNEIECKYSSRNFSYNAKEMINIFYRDYAIAHNLKMSYMDIEGQGSGTFLLNELNKTDTFSIHNFEASIANAKTEDEVQNFAISYLTQCLSWFDFTSHNLSNLLPFGLGYSYRTQINSVRKRNEDERLKQENPSLVQETTSITNDDRLYTDKIVRITGTGTRNNKERIKELGNQWLKDYPNFKAPSYWRGNGARWIRTAESWEIPKGAWLQFKEQYPNELHVLKAEDYN